jgi:Zn-dependent protease
VIQILLQGLRSGDIQSTVIVLVGYILALLVGIALHEFAHAWVAYRLGDMSPVRDGRLTINPMAHLDPFGTLLIVLVGFGYGRPVMVNPYAFRIDRRTGMALVAIAGPITNIIIAVAFGISMRFLLPLWTPNAPQAFEWVIQIFYIMVSLNVGLALFNMIPFPPLDGSKVLLALLPGNMAYSVERFYIQTQQYGMIVLLLLMWFGGSFIGALLSGPQTALVDLIIGSH